jgi:hypothetical protein
MNREKWTQPREKENERDRYTSIKKDRGERETMKRKDRVDKERP